MKRSRFVLGRRPSFLGVSLGAGLSSAALIACASVLGIEDRSATDVSVEGGVAVEGGSVPFADANGTDGATGTDGGSIVPGTDATTSPPDEAGLDDTARPVPEAGSDAGIGPVDPACTSACLVTDTLNHPWLLASDATNVYWTEWGDQQGSANGFVKSCPVIGCPTAGPTVLAQGLVNPRGIAVDADAVYFATATYSSATGGIFKCAKGGCGGSPTRLANAGIPYGVAVDGTSVYWSDTDPSEMRKVAKAGAATTTALFTESSPVVEPGLFAVDSTTVFLSDINQSAYSVGINGGALNVLGSVNKGGPFGAVYGVASDATFAYFGGDGSIFSALKTGGGLSTLTNVVAASGLTVDPQSGQLYWSDFGSGAGNDGTVGKVSADGSGRTVIASALENPCAVTLSGGYVWWLDRGTSESNGDVTAKTGRLWRQAK